MIEKLDDDFKEYDYIGFDEIRTLDVEATINILKDKINEIIVSLEGDKND